MEADLKPKAAKLALAMYSLTTDLKEAMAIIDYMQANANVLREAWTKADQAHRRVCVNCDKTYIVAKSNAAAEGFCTECDSPAFRKELMRVQKQNRRAARMNKLATLTFKEWIATLRHFKGRCAYCQRELFHDMEHFVPLRVCGVGRGTSVNNVVPACSACNYYKKSRNPYNERAARRIRIPKSDLDRVRNYLASPLSPPSIPPTSSTSTSTSTPNLPASHQY